jgi:hypothetical protein
MSKILKFTIIFEFHDLNISSFTEKNIKMILDDIEDNIDEYKIFDTKLPNAIILILYNILDDIEDNIENKNNTQLYSAILLILEDFNENKYPDQTNTYIKKTTKSNDPNNYLTEDDIKILYNPKVKKEELEKLLHKNKDKDKDNNYIIKEIENKIYELENKEKIELELNKELNNSADDSISEYQKSNSAEIQKFNNELLSDKKIILDVNTFTEFSILNYNMYPKLISLMLHPKYFCDIWYTNTDIIESESPYKIINKILDTLFILSYKHIKPNDSSFMKKHNYMFKRDTLICKSLQIQNLKNYKDSLNNEFTNQDNIIEYKNKLKIIDKKINSIKSDEKQYIFNYKLLNELDKYYIIYKKDIKRNTGKLRSSIEYENVIEFYYYNDEIIKSLKKIKDFDKNITECNGILTKLESNACNINYLKIINNEYIKLMSSHAQVLTYVKERNDANRYNLNNKINPRYKIEIKDNKKDVYKNCNDPSKGSEPKIKYYDFNISYFNEPNRIGFKNDDDAYTNYNQTTAEEFVNDRTNIKKWEHYKLGKINRYYGWNMTSEEISKDLECGLILLEKLRRFEDIIIVGNGQSGAGKTASLIGFMDGKTHKHGLLPNLANQLINPEQESKDSNNNIQYFYKATVKLINLYLNLDDNLNNIEDMELKHYYPYNIKLFDKNDDGSKKYIEDKEFIFKTDNNKWICKTESRKEKTLDQIISEAFEIREVEPTKNNPNSSRSHIIVCVTFTGSTMVNNEAVEKEAKIVICDFAGVEDKFTCELLELMMLDKNYYEKSDKYRIVNDEKREISDSDRKEKNMTYINYDNYFCSNKYNKYNKDEKEKKNEETDKARLKEFELFPKNKIIEKNKMINEYIQYIDYFNKLNNDIDPIKKSINTYIQNYNTNKINANDIFSFTNIGKEIFTKYNNDNIINTNDNKYELLNENILMLTINPIVTECTEINNCCNTNKDNYTNIENFMKDFKILDDTFYNNYKLYEVDDIKLKIKNKINNIINKKFDLTIDLTDFNYDLTDEIKTKIDSINDTNKNIKQTIKEKHERDISDNGANHQNAQQSLNEYKEIEKNKLNYTNNINLMNISSKINDINNKINKLTTKKEINDAEILKYENYKKELKSTSRFTASTNELYDIVIGYIKKKYNDNDGTYSVSNFNKYKYETDGLNTIKNTKGLIFENVIVYLNNEIKKLKNTWKPKDITLTNYKNAKETLDLEYINIENKHRNDIKEIDNINSTSIKQRLDTDSLTEKTEKETAEKIRYETEMNKYINEIIKKNYYNKLIEYKKQYIKKKIEEKFEERKKDYNEIKLLIQQLIRLSQLEFNCSIRRKEGYMINTSLKEMQKFIGSILFESTKNRYNKLLIENNLLVLDKKYYRDSDYIEHNNKISSSLNSIKNDIIKITNESFLTEDEIIIVKDRIIHNVKSVKKQVLKYFTYILSTLNNKQLEYDDNINLIRLLIYICFIDAINLIFINDSINFEIIFYLLSIMGDGLYTTHFNKLMNSIKNNSEYNFNTSDSNDNIIKRIFYYNHVNILKLVFDYSEKPNKNEKLTYIFYIIKQFDFYTKHKTKDGVNLENDIIVMNDSNKNLDEITNIQYSNIKFNTVDDIFKKFVTDYKTICTLLYSDTQEQLKTSEDNLNEALNTSSKSHMTPILYFPPSTDICTENKYKYENEYEKFYYQEKDKPKNNLEMLFNIMKTPSNKEIAGKKGSDIYNFGIKGFGLNMEKSTLVIFTVINVTPNPYAPTNNPPIPPFININKLKLIHKIVNIDSMTSSGNTDDLKNHIDNICKKYLNKLKNYKFYESLEVKEILDANKIFNDKGKLLKEKIIDLIDSNNATTLIGTVDFEKFTKIRDPEKTYFICDDKSDSVLLKLENIEKISEQLGEAIKNEDQVQEVQAQEVEEKEVDTGTSVVKEVDAGKAVVVKEVDAVVVKEVDAGKAVVVKEVDTGTSVVKEVDAGKAVVVKEVDAGKAVVVKEVDAVVVKEVDAGKAGKAGKAVVVKEAQAKTSTSEKKVIMSKVELYKTDKISFYNNIINDLKSKKYREKSVEEKKKLCKNYVNNKLSSDLNTEELENAKDLCDQYMTVTNI